MTHPVTIDALLERTEPGVYLAHEGSPVVFLVPAFSPTQRVAFERVWRDGELTTWLRALGVFAPRVATH